MNRSVRGRLRWLVPVLLLGVLVLLGANFWRLNQPPPPDPRLIAMAVRATVFALPTATPFVREIRGHPRGGDHPAGASADADPDCDRNPHTHRCTHSHAGACRPGA